MSMVGVFLQRKTFLQSKFKTKNYTSHPELLDKSGNITEEELLTVRFSNDNDSSLEEKAQQVISRFQLGKELGIKNKNCFICHKIS